MDDDCDHLDIIVRDHRDVELVRVIAIECRDCGERWEWAQHELPRPVVVALLMASEDTGRVIRRVRASQQCDGIHW